MDQAWVVAVDMGYGHQRAAYPFRDMAYDGIITANTGAMVDPAERKRLRLMSRASKAVASAMAWRVAATSSSGVVATSNRADSACAGTVLSTRP
jgi:hypothetical protein